MNGPILSARQRDLEVALRPLAPSDAEQLIAWMADPVVLAGLGSRFPMTLESELGWINKTANDPSRVNWAIDVDGKLVGTCGIQKISPIDHHGTTGTIIGDRAVWHQGIGTIAMQLRTRYAFEELNLYKLKSAYLATNEFSGRAQAKSGYQIVGRLKNEVFRGGQWVDMILTEVLREDWLALQASQTSV